MTKKEENRISKWNNTFLGSIDIHGANAIGPMNNSDVWENITDTK